MRPHVSVLLLTIFASSCAPRSADYQRPSLSGLIAKNWKGKAKVATKPQALPNEWWKHFKSPTLNGLVAKALNANQDLAGGRARVETARALVGAKRADWYPELDSTAGVSTQRLSESAFGANLPPQFGSVGDLVKRDNFRAALDMSYEVDLWGRVKKSVESAEASVRSADETLLAQRLMVAAEVARN
jgi:outer membrane protein TolC